MASVTRPTIFWHTICPQSCPQISISHYYSFICDTYLHIAVQSICTLYFYIFFRLLLTGVEPLPADDDSFFENREIIEVLAGNLFDGDMGYNMVGFGDHITVPYIIFFILFSSRKNFLFTQFSFFPRFTFIVHMKQLILAK